MKTELVPRGANGHSAAVPAVVSAGTKFAEMWDLAVNVSATGFFDGIDTPEKAFTLMLICDAQNIHPGHALTRYHIIKKKPSMTAAAMLAEFIAAGGIVADRVREDDRAQARFIHPVQAPDPGIVVSFTMEEARAAGLLAQNGDMYKKYPKNMLWSRMISTAVNMILPGIRVGIYTPEEIHDMTAADPVGLVNLPMPGPKSIDVTPRDAAGDDLPVIGWRGTGRDDRSYLDMARQASAEVKDRIASACRASGVDPPPDDAYKANKLHAGILLQAIGEGIFPKPETPPRSSDALKIISETIYPEHRAWVRLTLSILAHSKLDYALASIEGAEPQSEPNPAEGDPPFEPGSNG